MTGDPIISVTMATISNKADPDLVLELFPARLNDFDHLLRREVQYVSLFEVYPHWILIICILSFTTDTYELSICCKTSNWHLYKPASPSTSYRAPSPTSFWVSSSRWMSRFRFLNHRNQCDQMLEKSSPNFSKSCSKSCHGSFYLKVMFVRMA